MHFSRYIINNRRLFFAENISCFLKCFQQAFERRASSIPLHVMLISKYSETETCLKPILLVHSRVLLRQEVRQGGQQRALHRRGVRVLRAASVAGAAARSASIAPSPVAAPGQEASGGAGVCGAHPRQ